jgi:ribosomal protein S18 acetylase RimI-like enzyme
MLIQTHQLTPQQLCDLDLLLHMCHEEDGHQVAVYRHLLMENRGRPSSILCYQGQLVGFLAAFFFHDESCEIALMVAPAYRRQGIASLMFKAILPLIDSEGIDTLIFSAPHAKQDAYLQTLGFQYQGSEYQMQRLSSEPVLHEDAASLVRLATAGDAASLGIIAEACFVHEDHQDDVSRLYRLLQDSNHCFFLIVEQGLIVGSAHLVFHGTYARLSDIAVLPQYQRRGLGFRLLAHCINHALHHDQSDIRLDVESQNQHALGLYLRLGFQVYNAHDYWRIDKKLLRARS